MTYTIRRILAVALVVTLGIALGALELHRQILQVVWPALSDYFSYLFA